MTWLVDWGSKIMYSESSHLRIELLTYPGRTRPEAQQRLSWLWRTTFWLLCWRYALPVWNKRNWTAFWCSASRPMIGLRTSSTTRKVMCITTWWVTYVTFFWPLILISPPFTLTNWPLWGVMGTWGANDDGAIEMTAPESMSAAHGSSRWLGRHELIEYGNDAPDFLPHDSRIKIAWIRDIVDVESLTSESTYFIRTSKEQSQSIRIVSKLDSDSDTVVVAELEVVGLDILWVDLEVVSELVDPEGIDECCKLPLSTVNLNFLWAVEQILEKSSPSCSLLNHHWFEVCPDFPQTEQADFPLPLFDPFWPFWPWPQLAFCWFWFHDQVVHWPLPFDLVLPFSFWLAFLILKWRGPFWSFAFLSFWFLTFAFAFLKGIDLGLLRLIELIDGLLRSTETALLN